MKSTPPTRTPLALACLMLLGAPLASLAQSQPDGVERIVITGNPLHSERSASPVSVLAGDELVTRRGGTLGETLDGLPGVSQTGFGPNASRPVIRGLDGDRLRVLDNSGATIDASALSYDHAVPLDPLVATRIEVLRGPAALLYGGNAVGGVVNVLDNRIPLAPVAATGGSAELRLGGAAAERAGAAVVETGGAGWALHVDAAARNASDLNVPEHTPVADGEALSRTDEVRNSAARSRSAAVGASYFFEGGRFGLAVDHYDSDYGTVAEPDVTILMRRNQVRAEGEWRPAGGAFAELKLQLRGADYEHREMEGSEVGTVFSSRGGELRLEARHHALGPLRGVVGVQAENFDFSALGEEAFVPDTTTRRLGLFALEEMDLGPGIVSAGARIERADVDSDGGERFGAAVSRRFTLGSFSLGSVMPLAPAWSVSANLAATERAPTYFELYADGVHAATGAYEQGDPTLKAERGTSVDLALQWKSGASKARAGVFATRFSRFISLDSANVSVDEDGNVASGDDAVPLYRFDSVRAQLHGFEFEAEHVFDAAGWRWTPSASADFTRATNRTTGEALPRIAPWRATLALAAARGDWTLRTEVRHAGRQDRVPEGDSATAGYTLLNLAATRHFSIAGQDALWYLKLDNATDRLAYNATAIETVRGLTPLAGRALSTGLRVDF
ncbi:TonB-dependent receptor [Rubrivivax gelatinosus]|uniref:TonB-dependent receptor n=2 Tax=Rubrivivax gelatinosus TaxID=28068 RepID=UPI001F5BE850|nr:TonB-dependent receptor [Rubrivivax gelatinosus]